MPQHNLSIKAVRAVFSRSFCRRRVLSFIFTSNQIIFLYPTLLMVRIQNLDPGLANQKLVAKPNGTYLVRRPTTNDDVISQIQIELDKTLHSPPRSYVVLSIRVDETVYNNTLVHYRLLSTRINGEENTSNLLEQYNRTENNLLPKRFTHLTNELIVSNQEQIWSIDPKSFEEYSAGLNFSTGLGKNNKGLCKATWQNRNQHSVKVFIKKFGKDDRYFKSEYELLKKVAFFHIVPLYGHYSDSRFDYLVLAYSGRSLESLCPLRTRSNKSRMSRVVNIGFQIANGMVYLEKKNIVHRDLTAGNVLVDRYGYIRIADFGHAIQKKEDKNTLERPVTASGEERFQFRFLAPECLPEPIRKQAPKVRTTPADIYANFSSKSDVWSFGILLIQLMIAKPSKPYPKLENDLCDVPQYVKIDRQIHECPTGCSYDVFLQLKRCWAYDAKDRASFSELRERMLQLELIYR